MSLKHQGGVTEAQLSPPLHRGFTGFCQRLQSESRTEVRGKPCNRVFEIDLKNMENFSFENVLSDGENTLKSGP